MKTANPFGPWSTPLGAGSRLELRAFWRRRMQAITTLAQAPRNVERRIFVAAIVVAALLVAAPLLHFASAHAAADDQSTTQIVGQATAQPLDEKDKFVAKFSNGIEVEFIGLSMNPSRGQPWWRPDGSPLDETPYSRMRANLGGESREICFRWRNLPEGPDQTLQWSTFPHYNAAGGSAQPLDENGQQIAGLDAAAFAFDADLASCAVRFSASVAATPWKTVFQSDGRGHQAHGSSAGGRPRSVAWAPAAPYPVGLPQGVSITVTHSAPGEEARLIAIDKSGAEHLASRSPGTGASNYFMRTYYFDQLKPGDVERFELQTQTRQIETAEFTNVSLEPNKLTKVDVRMIQAATKSAPPVRPAAQPARP